MGGGDHDAAFGLEEGVGEVAHGGGGEADVEDVGAFVNEALREGGEEGVGGFATVAGDDDAAGAGELRVGAGDPVEGVVVEVAAIDAAYVVCFEYAHFGVGGWGLGGN